MQLDLLLLGSHSYLNHVLPSHPFLSPARAMNSGCSYIFVTTVSSAINCPLKISVLSQHCFYCTVEPELFCLQPLRSSDADSAVSSLSVLVKT